MRPHLDETFGKFSRRDKWRLAFALFLVLGAWFLITAAISHQKRLHAIWRGECDLAGNWQYEQPHEVSAATFASLDLDRIHTELLPRWVTAAARLHQDPFEEVRAWASLVEGVKHDPNLLDLVSEQRQIVVEELVGPEAERMHYLVWAWNQYMDRAGQHYWVDGNVGVSRTQWPFFYVVTYVTRADVTVTVDTESERVRVVSRADPVNVRELHAGGASNREDGAFVVSDRVQDFVLDSLWPLLSEERPYAPGLMWDLYGDVVRAEVLEGVGPDHGQALIETAPARAALLEVAHAIAEREFCSEFAVIHTPFDGHAEETLNILALAAYYSIGHPCPRVKVPEMIILQKASDILRGAEGLQAALEALIAWTARSVAAHEARHLADLSAGGELLISCDGCGSDDVMAEISAYMASFAWAEGPYTAYYQACRAVESGRNPHAAAMEYIGARLDRECIEPPPEDLPRRARQLEHAVFGRSQSIAVPDEFPVSLGIARAAGRRRSVVSQ